MVWDRVKNALVPISESVARVSVGDDGTQTTEDSYDDYNFNPFDEMETNEIK